MKWNAACFYKSNPWLRRFNKESSSKIHNPSLCSKKVNPFALSHQIHRHICLKLFWLVNSAWSAHISLLIQMTFSAEKAIWIEDSYLSQKQQLEVKNMDLFLLTYNFSLHKMLTSVMWITCELLECFYQFLGLSFWRHPFTAEERIHWWTSDVMQNLSKYVPIKKKTQTVSTSWMAWGFLKC